MSFQKASFQCLVITMHPTLFPTSVVQTGIIKQINNKPIMDSFYRKTSMPSGEHYFADGFV